MLFLLRLNMRNKPATAPNKWLVRSPSTCSILMTSAPTSASTKPQVGPMTMWVNSTTRSLVSGRRRPEGRSAWVLVSAGGDRSEEHTSELQSLMRISYAVFCLKKKKIKVLLNITYSHDKVEYRTEHGSLHTE